MDSLPSNTMVSGEDRMGVSIDHAIEVMRNLGYPKCAAEIEHLQKQLAELQATNSGLMQDLLKGSIRIVEAEKRLGLPPKAVPREWIISYSNYLATDLNRAYAHGAQSLDADVADAKRRAMEVDAWLRATSTKSDPFANAPLTGLGSRLQADLDGWDANGAPVETTASRCATCDDGECSVHPSSAQSEEGSRP